MHSYATMVTAIATELGCSSGELAMEYMRGGSGDAAERRCASGGRHVGNRFKRSSSVKRCCSTNVANCVRPARLHTTTAMCVNGHTKCCCYAQ